MNWLVENQGWILSTLVLLIPLLWVNIRFYLANKRLVSIKEVTKAAPLFVGFVEQTMQTKPAHLTQDAWNAQRLETAMQSGQNYALSLGLKLNDLEYLVLQTAILGALGVLNANKPIRGAVAINPFTSPHASNIALLASNSSIGKTDTLNDSRVKVGLEPLVEAHPIEDVGFQNK